MPRHLKPAVLLLPLLLLAVPVWGAAGQDEPTGALATALEPVLSSKAGPGAQPIPEIGLEELARLVVQAIAGKSWSLLASLLVVGVVLVLRQVGARVWPWLGTERGVALLSVVGGTGTLLALALSGGQPFSLGLLLSCLMGALSASGLWSVSKSLVRPKAEPKPACLPEEVANGTCRPG